MSVIVEMHAREIIDSRGNPTIEADVMLDSRRAWPRGGTLRGLHRYARGGGTARRRSRSAIRARASTRAVDNVNTLLREVLIGKEALDQAGIDARMMELDGTREQRPPGRQRDPGRVAGQSARGRANEAGVPLFKHLLGTREPVMPVPMMNIINGGAHANNSLDIQEFMILPVGRALAARGAALWRRDLPHAEEDTEWHGAEHGRGG